MDGGLRRADARALLLFANVGLATRQAGDVQREAPGRRMRDRALELEPALDQRAGDLALQIGGRLSLHAGRDFFGKEFEEEVGHRNRRVKKRAVFSRMRRREASRKGRAPATPLERATKKWMPVFRGRRALRFEIDQLFCI